MATPRRSRRANPWAVFALAAVIIGAAVGLFYIGTSTVTQDTWRSASVTLHAYAASLTESAAIAAFGSMAIQGPFAIEVISNGTAVDVSLAVNGEPVHRGSAFDYAYAYSFEASATGPPSTDLILSLPDGAAQATVTILLWARQGYTPRVYHTANVGPSSPIEGLFGGPFLFARSAAPEPTPVESLAEWTYDFPRNADSCYAESTSARGSVWVNVTAPADARYYMEVQFNGPAQHFIMADVQGDVAEHVHWTAGEDVDVSVAICKPSVAGDYLVTVDGGR